MLSLYSLQANSMQVSTIRKYTHGYIMACAIKHVVTTWRPVPQVERPVLAGLHHCHSMSANWGKSNVEVREASPALKILSKCFL